MRFPAEFRRTVSRAGVDQVLAAQIRDVVTNPADSGGPRFERPDDGKAPEMGEIARKRMPGTDAVVVVHRGPMLDLAKVDLYIDRALTQSMALRRSPNARIFQSFPDEDGVAVVKTFVEVNLSHDPGAQDLPVGAVAERFEATDVLYMHLVGPYPRDDSLHAALRKRAEELGLEPTGPPRHYLLSNPDDGEPSGLRQEVQLPVEEKE